MSLRTKLIAAFLLLSALPLSAIVLYSYGSSIRSLRQAALAENTALADEMSERMSGVKQGVDRRLQRLAGLPLDRLREEWRSDDYWQSVLSEVDAGLGEAAPFVEALEFVPAAPPPEALAPPPVPVAGHPPPDAGAPAAHPSPPAAAPPESSRLVIWLNKGGERQAEGGPGGSLAFRFDFAALETLLAETARHTATAAARAAHHAVEVEGRRLARVTPPEPPRPPGAGRAPMPPAGLLAPEARAALLAAGSPAGLPAAVLGGTVEWGPARPAEQRAREKESKALLGRDFECAVESQGKKLGHLKARLAAKQLLHGVLALTRRDKGEIPFAIDGDGTLHTAGPADLEALEELPLAADREEPPAPPASDWVVVKVKDEESGLIYGIARPLGESLGALRATAGRNFAYGMGVVGLALVGIAPLSRRITRDLSALTQGARELAAGNLETRVPVRGRDEVGRLSATFNRMAADLADHQRRLLEEERLRKEHELERRLLEAENERKTRELEDARDFQLSLLPKRLPDHPQIEIAVFMRTATEVGGDYYDFHLGEGGTLTVAIGDATGHGTRAGTMVTVIKSLFAARVAGAELPEFLAEAGRTIRCMELGRMAMALALLRISGRRLAFASAGMPGALVCRAATGAVEEIAVAGVPLGSLSDCAYHEAATDLAPGDTVLLLSDGFPELTSGEGEVQGYPRAEAAFAAAAARPAGEVIAHLAQAATAWKGGAPPDDDVTFVVLKVRGEGA
jgi:serine phosphatase RsbU (regulator of sigma subunit)